MRAGGDRGQREDVGMHGREEMVETVVREVAGARRRRGGRAWAEAGGGRVRLVCLKKTNQTMQ